ncbi:hypothetical protein CC1G_14786 [Coprinopsis cinerea okayama7|uniref:Major facilitator superfamily (MFS) profile domain-containing protein n=1 Tax=Coprinopsis cinerea (strain Okayama-7 / 130 / ATCC MYA-4618 / FGSC 9003) TaxID=240176 RepID=D6RNG7_COPC7|nr:hypothetical protein CC1G_14786 [Coprinopsis cinerea okayama7\|eukprot:XP_002910808.1 hypothetical protein CC1G_14786 [Coprinopsis cinerea okayama7\
MTGKAEHGSLDSDSPAGSIKAGSGLQQHLDSSRASKTDLHESPSKTELHSSKMDSLQDLDSKTDVGSSKAELEIIEKGLKGAESDSVVDEAQAATRLPEGGSIEKEIEIDSRRLWRKVDLKLLPILTVMYLFSFMDRANIGAFDIIAQVAIADEGLEEELNMTGSQYNLALPYCLFEVPSNLLLKKFRPSRWLPFLTVFWGLVVLVTGFVKNFPQLLALRIVLGAAEAGFYPGVVYYLSLWYPRNMYQTRMAYFFGAASMAGAFSGLLAYAIGFMDGLSGMRGWSWIFEG